MECSICLLPMSADNSVKLSCGHLFHGQCFVNYVQHEGVTCPLCRESCVYDNLSDSSDSSDYEEEETTTISLRAARAHARFDNVLKRMFETRHKWMKETKKTHSEFTRLRKLLNLKDAQFEARMRIMKHKHKITQPFQTLTASLLPLYAL